MPTNRNLKGKYFIGMFYNNNCSIFCLFSDYNILIKRVKIGPEEVISELIFPSGEIKDEHDLIEKYGDKCDIKYILRIYKRVSTDINNIYKQYDHFIYSRVDKNTLEQSINDVVNAHDDLRGKKIIFHCV